MTFLDKLYESNYFGIGLFAVISFLVVTFLVVLFFGKKDEKKRKLEETNSNLNLENNAFKEVSEAKPLDVPVTPNEPTPINVEQAPIQTPIMPVNPINYEEVKPVAPISYEEPKEDNFIENLTVEEQPKVDVTPIHNIEPIRLDTVKYDAPVEPKVMEPVKINIPEEPTHVEPLIKEEETPIVTPIIEESVIPNTYYQPIEKEPVEEVNVPNIDFDAIAKSISQELDDLERNTTKEEVKVTPINEINTPTHTPNQFSSVYVNEPVRNTMRETIDLPKKIDLPTKKNDNIEPENYSI